MFRKSAVILATTLALGAPLTANASSITVEYQTPGNVFSTPYSDVGIVSFTSSSPARSGSFRAGPFELKAFEIGDFVAWCVDIAQNISSGKSYHVNNDLHGGPGSDTHANIDALFSTFYADVDTKEEKSAFQFVLWELLYDDGLDLSEGTFQDNGTDGAIRAIADDYLAGIVAPDAKSGKYRYTFLESADSQDVITVSAVPLPAAAWMLLASIMGLAGLRRRAST